MATTTSSYNSGTDYAFIVGSRVSSACYALFRFEFYGLITTSSIAIKTSETFTRSETSETSGRFKTFKTFKTSRINIISSATTGTASFRTTTATIIISITDSFVVGTSAGSFTMISFASTS